MYKTWKKAEVNANNLYKHDNALPITRQNATWDQIVNTNIEYKEKRHVFKFQTKGEQKNCKHLLIDQYTESLSNCFLKLLIQNEVKYSKF